MKKNFIEELKWRRMLQDAMPGTEKLLQKEMVSAYIGFDPTADSLGVGNLVQIMTLLHFQNCGHKPIALVGGATGMVGDPSGKSAERNLLDEKTLNHNLACQKAQLEKFLDFNCGANAAEIVNNYDWFKNMSFLEFIRDVGKHLTVNYMMAKDSVKNRISGEDREGMSFTEFAYQLVQGYDFYYLWKNRGVKMQMGGSDQWGNIVTGTELIRRKDGGEAWALVTPLIKKADGTKFGKTESGNIWLDPKRTSPYEFYQFWLNGADSDSENYIRIFTLKSQEEIEKLEAEHRAEPHLRKLQKAIAEDITTRVHGKDALNAVVGITALFMAKDAVAQMEAMDDSAFTKMVSDAGTNAVEIPAAEFANGINIIDILHARTKMFESNGDAMKMIKGNGVSLNKVKVTDPKMVVNTSNLIKGKYLLVQKGKNDYCLVQIG
ncbi:MAG TPA: tyrosine--tRNA ligase [Bacteroidia bacterium]|jgi:tyrosyl-tRNA synthetase|nr:tyrosine--tRNA ligase [Bacteroidia bacterium]